VAALVLGATGIVFGDIGTSPLYTIQECLHSRHGAAPSPANVFGVVSLIVWSLTLVVTVKYLAFLMRADNDGEGGIMALLALVPDRVRRVGRVGPIAALVVVGASLLLGDGIITPAISVLAAMEGLEVATVALKPYVVEERRSEALAWDDRAGLDGISSRLSHSERAEQWRWRPSD
jgi:KUP system potassium uptake protein